VRISLANREAQLMGVLWKRGACTVAEVLKELNDELAYTTVLSILRTLESKGYVNHRRTGRAYRWFTTIERAAAQRSAVRGLARKLFEGSVSLLLSQAVADEPLSEDEIKHLRRLIDAAATRTKP
jgi:BlaI family transcriptional regulator, penicillinase repressor